MNIHFTLTAIGIITAFVTCTTSQTGRTDSADKANPVFRIMFYNTENFFDTVDDTLTADEDFTPSGALHWTYKRYSTKLRNTYKVIVAVGRWQPPDIIGLCEVENRRVLEDLVNNTPLAKYSYTIIHENSPDRRGIDVALLYNRQTVRFISSRSYHVRKPGLLTRDILYGKVLLGTDTCHFLVNHWPSRSEGQIETERDRFAAARSLKHIADSLLNRSVSNKIVIMGDFNDEPSDESLIKYLNAELDMTSLRHNGLYNLTVVPSSGAVKGSLKYQGQWNTFDQMIVSGNMLAAKEGLVVGKDHCRIFIESYLLAEDNNYNGYKPFRTYSGFNYLGGFSDHLPVYMDLIFR